MSNLVKCQDCEKNVVGNSIYCNSCKNIHTNDLLVFIDKDKILEFDRDQYKQCENLLSMLTYNIRLDYHGVVDLFDVNEKISQNKICVVSFVGKHSKIRLFAQNDIKSRIASGQVDIGILIFKRGFKGSKKYHCFTDIGSKAWVNKFIKIEKGKNAIFVDDSYDHVASVGSIKLLNFTSYHLIERQKNSVTDLLKNY